MVENFSFFPATYFYLNNTEDKGIIKHVTGFLITLVALPLTVYRLIMFAILYIILLTLDIINLIGGKNKKW